MSLSITILPALSDNYIYLIKDNNSGYLAAVDPSEASPVLDYLESKNEKLDLIGGPESNIPGIDQVVKDGDKINIGDSRATAIQIPGHTLDQIAFWFEKEKIVFTGDTLFSIGCGRIFEGNPKMMWDSLCKLRDLPSDTKVYCGHEYTEKNIEFALSLEPDNSKLKNFQAEIIEVRKKNQPTMPSTIKNEALLNPFLRADEQSFKDSLGMSNSSEIDVFTEIRKRKDNY
jgi:hydroxyacylglutathione hydrolase